MNIPGVKLNLGGKIYVCPPLNFKSLRIIRPKLAMLTSGTSIPNEEQLDGVIDVVQLALQRNYPDITREELEEVVDLDNLKDIIAVVMGVSGLERELPTDAGKAETLVEKSAGGISTLS